MQSRELTAMAQETNIAVGVLQTQMAECLTLTKADLAGDVLTPGTNLMIDPLLRDQVMSYSTPNYADGDELPQVLQFQLSLDWLSANRRTRNLTVLGLRR